MGELHPYSTIWEHNIVVILHIYRSRDKSLLFFVLQDTESVSCVIEMSLYQPIFTHKNISKDLWGNGIYTLQDGSRILWQFSILMELEPIPYYFCDHQDTESATCPSPRYLVRSHYLVCIENHSFFVGIGPILNKQLELIFRSD